MTPARWSAAATRAIFGNPFNPLAYTLPGRLLDASAAVFSGVAERKAKPAWGLAARIEVVAERPFCRLLRFVPPGDRTAKPRLLLVAPLSGHHATLLRGTVAALMADHDVYVTDWTDARDVPLAAGRFDLDTYLDYLIGDLRRLGPDVHVVAVCQPAPLVLAAVALMASAGDPAQPRSMVLMGGPVDTRVAPTAPTKLAAERPLAWFESMLTTAVPAWYPGAGRRVYPGFVQLSAFLAMNPERHVEAHREMLRDLVGGRTIAANGKRAFYDEYFAVMDIPAEYYLQTVDVVFQRHALAEGTMTWRGRRVDPAAIRATALMTVEGEEDDISAPGQTLAAQTLCSSLPDDMRAQYLQPGVGHYGIFNGSRWRSEIAPRIGAFIAQHAAAAAPAPAA